MLAHSAVAVVLLLSAVSALRDRSRQGAPARLLARLALQASTAQLQALSLPAVIVQRELFRQDLPLLLHAHRVPSGV